MSFFPKLKLNLPKLPDLGKIAEKAVNEVAQTVKDEVDDFAKDVRREVVQFGNSIGSRAQHVPLPSLDFPAISTSGRSGPEALLPQLKLPKIKLPGFVRELFGTTRPELDKFVKSTADFRSTLQTLRTTQPGDPRYAAAAAHLKAKYGYTPETAPKPGTQWISPRLSGALIPGGQVNASTWPTGQGRTEPPTAAEALFAYGKNPTLKMADGREVTVQSVEHYKALVAENRAVAGIKSPDGSPANGEPKAVHLTMEGGGGLGKRYSPAFQEMYALGLVPTSVSGTSVGAIAAGYIAAGADPKTVQALATDPALEKFFDFKLGGSAVTNGKFMYEYVDQKLRELTGIKDRPVTFADLKIPLHLPAAIMSDSMPPKGMDYTKPENRLFTFGPETTPNTPVVYAMLASGAFPGVLPTVDLVDPTSGRKLVLTDSGVIDGIPMDMGKRDLPEIGLTLQEPHSNHPRAPEHNKAPKALPPGDIDTSNPVSYGLNSLKMLKDSAAAARDFRDRTQPKPGEFMLAIPIFNVDDGRLRNKSLVFPSNPKVDPVLDQQGGQIARSFFAKVFNDIGDPNKSATNIVTQVPANLQFQQTVDFNGQRYHAQYTGGDHIRFTKADGGVLNLEVGKLKAEAMYLDEIAFGALDAHLKVVLDDHFNPLNKIRRDLPF